MSRCSLSKFQAMSCNSLWSRGTEKKELQRRVVAQTKRRTVLFDILPKVHNWKKNLWPVRNPGCGGKCFLGWGKQASRPVSCLGHGWTNMQSLASGWKVVMMRNILDGFILNDFQDYSGTFVLRLQKKKLFLRAAGIILCNTTCWCFGTSKILLRRFKFSKSYKHNLAWQGPLMRWQVICWNVQILTNEDSTTWNAPEVKHLNMLAICCVEYTAQGSVHLRANVATCTCVYISYWTKVQALHWWAWKSPSDRKAADDTGPNTMAVIIVSVFCAAVLFSFHQKSSSHFLRPGCVSFMHPPDFLREIYVGFFL